jgi:Flp pilus assembly protein TadG
VWIGRVCGRGLGRNERGSTTIEGIVAMGVFFLLIALVVQLGFLVIARTAVGASLDAAARRSAAVETDPATQRDRIVREIATIAPGVDVVETKVVRTANLVTVTAVIDWSPPGPDLFPIRLSISRSHALAVPP